MPLQIRAVRGRLGQDDRSQALKSHSKPIVGAVVMPKLFDNLPLIRISFREGDRFRFLPSGTAPWCLFGLLVCGELDTSCYAIYTWSVE